MLLYSRGSKGGLPFISYPNFHQWSGRLRKSQIRYAAADAWFPLLIAVEWGLIDIDVCLGRIRSNKCVAP